MYRLLGGRCVGLAFFNTQSYQTVYTYCNTDFYFFTKQVLMAPWSYYVICLGVCLVPGKMVGSTWLMLCHLHILSTHLPFTLHQPTAWLNVLGLLGQWTTLWVICKGPPPKKKKTTPMQIRNTTYWCSLFYGGALMLLNNIELMQSLLLVLNMRCSFLKDHICRGYHFVLSVAYSYWLFIGGTEILLVSSAQA